MGQYRMKLILVALGNAFEALLQVSQESRIKFYLIVPVPGA